MPSSTYRRRFDYRAVRNRRTYQIAAQTSVAVEAVVTASPVRRLRSGGKINLTNPVNWQHPLNKQLVAWYPGLASQLGVVYHDVAGRNRGTLTAGPTWGAGPNGHAALTFNGSSQYVGLGILASLNLTRSFSVSMWLKRNGGSSATARVPFGNGRGGSAGWGIGLGVTGHDYYFVKYGVIVADSGVASTDGKWEHVLWTVDSSYVARLYVDGQLRFTSGNTQTISAPTRPAFVGAEEVVGGTMGSWFPGSVSDLRVWSRTLNDGDAAALYHQSRRGHPNTLRRVGRGSVSVASISAPGSASILPIVQHHRLMQGIR